MNIKDIISKSKVPTYSRYYIASTIFLVIWVWMVACGNCNSMSSAFALHPVDNFDLFLLFVSLSAVISWMLHDLRLDRQTMQQIAATIMPILFELAIKAEYYQNSKDPQLQAEAEDAVIRRAKLDQQFSENEESLSANIKVSSFLFFANVIIIGYITYCVTRAVIQGNASNMKFMSAFL